MATYRGQEIDLKPTAEMQRAAERGLEFRREHRRGGTDVGIARARQLVNRQELSPSTVRRMRSFFARHEVDKKADGFREGEPGYPSNGLIAWLLWGGDPGKAWAERKTKELDNIDSAKSIDITNDDGNISVSGSEGAVMRKNFTTFPFELKALTEERDFWVFEGYAATFGNVDRGGDVVEQGAFQATILNAAQNATPIMGTEYRKLLPILWQHKQHEPVGSFVEMREDSVGLYVKGILPKADDFVTKRVVPQMRVGSISEMSIGYVTDDSEYENGVRKLKSVTLYEISLVTIPMNPAAKITGMKTVVPYQDLPLADDGRPWDGVAAERRVREWADAQDAPNEDYRSAFLWYDSENEENFGAYKLGIADVIDGELMAVPRAIFAAAAAMRGARGGVDIPESDRAGVIANIERYYRKMDRESPFGKSFRVDEISVLTERQLESALRDGASFTASAAKSIVAALKSSQRDVGGSDQREADISTALKRLNATIKSIV